MIFFPTFGTNKLTVRTFFVEAYLIYLFIIMFLANHFLKYLVMLISHHILCRK